MGRRRRDRYDDDQEDTNPTPTPSRPNKPPTSDASPTPMADELRRKWKERQAKRRRP